MAEKTIALALGEIVSGRWELPPVTSTLKITLVSASDPESGGFSSKRNKPLMEEDIPKALANTRCMAFKKSSFGLTAPDKTFHPAVYHIHELVTSAANLNPPVILSRPKQILRHPRFV